ncbi:glycoside hydrolase family 5 protein [Streptomyces sp. 110]|uniref:cellulase n=2 Tax=Streptomyces endocoffeicus TaxID=2898945 RepID=A0ABS1PQP7_9ACTN|nr:glycoside hydrolase family 5 protein [Streptomyces endocoffeicus]
MNSPMDQNNAPTTETKRAPRSQRLRFGIAAAVVAAAAVGGTVTAFAVNNSDGQSAATTTSAAGAKATGAGAEGPLSTKKGDIVDSDGKKVVLTGVNWFGFETGTYAPHGLWTRNWESMLDQMAKQGFNTMRLPYANDMFKSSAKPNGIDWHKNPDLKGLTPQQIMDKIVKGATDRGIRVILDQHRPDQYGQSELWHSQSLSEKQWMDDWVQLAKRYKNNDRVIGADLHNEPRGQATWGDGNPKTDWQLAATKAGNAIHKVNKNWLIFVEGTDRHKNEQFWWGGDLQGVKKHPVKLDEPNKVVYSAHDYGPGVYNQNWFMAKDFPKNMPAIWEKHWAYIKKQNIAPLLLGEFGGKKTAGKSSEAVWQNALMDYLKKHQISYTYWTWNPDSGDTGGVLKNDWKTIDQNKMKMLAKYQTPLLEAKKGK